MSNPVYLAAGPVPQIDTAACAWRRKSPAHIGGIKLGLEFFCAHGSPWRARSSRMTGLPIFLDLKLHDIPNTVAGAMQAIHVLEPAIVTVHASGGRAMLEDAKAAAGENTQSRCRHHAHQPSTTRDLERHRHRWQPRTIIVFATHRTCARRRASTGSCAQARKSPISRTSNGKTAFLSFQACACRAARLQGDQKRVVTPRRGPRRREPACW